jgi:hypothetical protein
MWLYDKVNYNYLQCSVTHIFNYLCALFTDASTMSECVEITRLHNAHIFMF